MRVLTHDFVCLNLHESPYQNARRCANADIFQLAQEGFSTRNRARIKSQPKGLQGSVSGVALTITAYELTQ